MRYLCLSLLIYSLSGLVGDIFAETWPGEPDCSTNTNLCHYIRDGANGDGSSWSSAWDSLPTDLQRGHKYYIGDGDYGSYLIDDAASGSTYIYIKKATGGDHGSGTGWSSAYGDGQAVFTSTSDDYQGGASLATTLKINSSPYIVIDGNMGSGTSGHGIKVTTTACSGGGVAPIGLYVKSSDYVKISRIESAHCGTEIDYYDSMAAYVAGSDNFHMKYSYLHDVTSAHLKISTSTYATIERNVMARRKQGVGGSHGQAIPGRRNGTAYHIIRYNTFLDISGTNIVSYMDNDVGAPHTHVYVYGNLFYTTDGVTYGTSDGAISNTGGDTNTQMYVFNNTFYKLQPKAKGGSSGINWGNNGDHNFMYNNLWVEAADVKIAGTGANGESDYNQFDNCGYKWNYDQTAEPNYSHAVASMVNKTGYNFRLIAPTATGKDLTGESWWSSKYCSVLDADGNARGSDGIWDRGAFEFVSGNACGNACGSDGISDREAMEFVSDAPSPPSSLRIFFE